MKLFDFYVSLRKDILRTITGVENSGYSLFWDDSTPNWITKNKLESLLDKYLLRAQSFGIYIVTRHCDCPNFRHGDDYYITNTFGLDIKYRDECFTWNGGQLFQGSRKCTCPCSKRNKETEHHVIDDIIYKNDANFDVCKNLEDIILDINSAIECSSDRKPRSAIREHLLRAVININDQLLPEPMDKYIENASELTDA